MVALAGVVWAGAVLAVPLPGWTRLLAASAVALALVARRPLLLGLAAAVLATGLGAAAHQGLAPPPQDVSGPVTLLSDPTPAPSGQRVEVRVGERRVEAWARGGAAGALVDRLSGERVWVRGRLGPLSERHPWLTARHVSARLEIDEVTGWAPGHPVHRVANGLRRTLVDGAEGLPEDTRTLFAGFVLGDDRGRSDLVTDDFRGAGLTHLLAVSGQNVAFVLALLDPLLRRLSLRWRLVATLGALGFFALLTRFEPSVLRATAMAAIATVAATWGREATSLRVLALAIAALVLVDPLLVASVGFQLSVAASLGIVLLAPRLRDLLPGPDLLRLPVAVAVAAQVGVAPVLLLVFGGLPVVGLPANLLAAPAAGPVTLWGLTAGLVAGVAPAGVAEVLHLPTRLLVGWVAGVAGAAVAVPLGQLGVATFTVAVAAGAAAARWWRRGRRPAARMALAVLLLVLLAPAAQLRWGHDPAHTPVAGDADLWRSEGHALVVLGGRVREADLLEGLREAGVTRLDVVVCRTSAGVLHTVVADLRRRFGGVVVLAPEAAGIDGAVVPPAGSTLPVGALTATFTPSDDELQVEVEPASGGRPGPV